MGTTDFLLNCFVLGDDEEKVFPVKIPRNDNVGILKNLIKKKNPFLKFQMKEKPKCFSAAARDTWVYAVNKKWELMH
jgi:hypothetical protein